MSLLSGHIKQNRCLTHFIFTYKGTSVIVITYRDTKVEYSVCDVPSMTTSTVWSCSMVVTREVGQWNVDIDISINLREYDDDSDGTQKSRQFCISCNFSKTLQIELDN